MSAVLLTFVLGNYSVHVKASPMIYDIIIEASKMVSLSIGSTSLSSLEIRFQVPMIHLASPSMTSGWKLIETVRRMNRSNSVGYVLWHSFMSWVDRCRIRFGLGAASDYYGFDQLVGSSNFDTSYDYNVKDHGNIASHPLYHTSYETFYTMKKFIDPEFLVSWCISNLFP